MKQKLLKIFLILFTLSEVVFAQTRTISGVVRGKEDGLPLPGVSVMVKGTKTGTQTGPDGSYSIKTSAGQELVFSFIGYNIQTIVPTGNQLNVTLSGSTSTLNEVQVIGYGTQSKRESVGSISTVKGSEIVEQPVQNFEQALAGKASGVQITIPSGVLNTAPIFHIRGTNSISLGSQPLIVVDGVVSFSANDGTAGTGNIGGGESGSNPLGNINPDDIESIDIAKDGASTAIYGSRAANGVVFITTKKGKKGNAVVSLDSWVGTTSATRLPKVLNAAQYVAEKNEALVNAGLYNASTYFIAANTDASGNPINTNWEKLLYRKGTSYNSSVSISGGTDKTTYYGSATYGNQQGILQKNSFNTEGILFNINHQASKIISMGVKLSYTDQMNLAATSSGSLSSEAYATAGLGRLAVLLPPNLSPYNNDGTYNLNPTGAGIGVMGDKGISISYPNPIPSLDLDRQNNELNHLAANIYLQVKPLPWITLKTTYGVDYIYSTNDSFTNPVSNFAVSSTGVVTNSASALDSYSQNKRYVWDNTAQFDYTFFQKNNFSLLLGNEQQATNLYGYGLSRTVLSDPAFNVIQAGYVNLTTPAANLINSQDYLVSFFGRLNYNFSQKYFLSATLRKDGYSAFGTNKKYGYFPGVGAAWAITQEKFWSNMGADKIFSSFKLQGSYAVVGNNAGLPFYASQTTYGSSLYNGSASLAPNGNGNNSLGWETSKKTDAGFTFGILNDRITGEAAYYRNNISGLIFNVPSAPSAGLYSSSLVNIGSMYNTGLEFTVNADIIRSKDFKWSSNFNISFNKNKITALIPGTNSFTYSTSSLEVTNINKVGGSVGDLFIVKSAGIDPANGRRIFINGKGQKVEYTFTGTQHWYYMDGTNAPAITQTADASDYKNATPKEIGGFSNSFRYKNFDLNVLFTYQLGFYVYYGTQATLTDQRFWNNSTVILDHWTTPGQVASYPKVVFGDNVSNGTSFPTDFNTYSGDFLKLKTINLGYTLPKPFLNRLGMSSLRIYATAQNLFILTKYPGPDPEVSSNGITNSAPGVDRNTVGNSRTFTAGFSVKF